MNKLSAFLLLAATGVLFTGCNKDDVIPDDSSLRPSIALDSEDGVYTVKAGSSLTIAPEFTNCSDAQITWTMDDEVVCSDTQWTAVWPEIGEYYVTITAKNRYGSASEDIRVDVLELTPPVISLAIPEGGLKVEAGTEYILAPDIQHSDGPDFSIEWYVDNNLVSTERQYSFSRSEVGTYNVKIVAANADGEAQKEFAVEVVPAGTGNSIRFMPLSYYHDSGLRFTFPGREVVLVPIVNGFSDPVFEWSLNGVPQDTHTGIFSFTPDTPGEYIVAVTVSSAVGNRRLSRVTRNISRGGAAASADLRIVCVDATEQDRMRHADASSSPWSNSVLEFLPAPGQFDDESKSCLTHEQACNWAKDCLVQRRYVSLGSFGGYIIVGFDHSIPAGSGQFDLAVEGNAFADGQGSSNEPGIVWVMQDVNGNGLPDDEWYQLKGSQYAEHSTIHNTYVTYYNPGSPGMSVEWLDAQGEKGEITFLSDYYPSSHVYFPAWLQKSSYTLYGTRLASNTVCIDGIYNTMPYAWGYADNVGSDLVKASDLGLKSGMFTGFSFTNAVQANGRPVSLRYVDFVKVQCGVLGQNPLIGEYSTEVLSFRDMSM